MHSALIMIVEGTTRVTRRTGAYRRRNTARRSHAGSANTHGMQFHRSIFLLINILSVYSICYLEKKKKRKEKKKKEKKIL